MANFAFYNIGAANKEITRLAARIAELEAAKPVDQSAQLADALASNDQISTELSAVKAELVSKETELTTSKSSIASLQAELAATKTSVAAQAAAQAAVITAAQGQPPLAVLPQSPTSSAGGDIVEQLNSIKDPKERVMFYRANKAAIDACYK